MCLVRYCSGLVAFTKFLVLYIQQHNLLYDIITYTIIVQFILYQVGEVLILLTGYITKLCLHVFFCYQTSSESYETTTVSYKNCHNFIT